MAQSSKMNFLCFMPFLMFFSLPQSDAASVSCSSNEALLWSQSLPMNAQAVDYGRVAIASDNSTIFATATVANQYAYLFGVNANGTSMPVMYSGAMAGNVSAAPVVINSTTVMWAPYMGGANNGGALVAVDYMTNTSTIQYNFTSMYGMNPEAIAYDPEEMMIFGATMDGGPYGNGTSFVFDVQDMMYTVGFNFTTQDAKPQAAVFSDAAIYLLIEAEAAGPDKIGSFDLTSPLYEDIILTVTSLVVSEDETMLYGTSIIGWGSLFSVNISGSSPVYTSLFNFTSDAGSPMGGLMLDETNNVLYGTTSSPYGSVYAYDLSTNKMTTLYMFSSTGGSMPMSGVALSSDMTTLYGITSSSDAGKGSAMFYALNACSSSTSSMTSTTAAPSKKGAAGVFVTAASLIVSLAMSVSMTMVLM